MVKTLDSDSLDSGSLDSFDAVSVVSPSPEFSLDAVSVFVGSVGSVVSDSGWLEDSVPLCGSPSLWELFAIGGSLVVFAFCISVCISVSTFCAST